MRNVLWSFLFLVLGKMAVLEAQAAFSVNPDGAIKTKSLSVTGALSVTQTVRALAGFGYVPLGTILPWYNVNAAAPLPEGWYKCDGQSVVVTGGGEADLLDGVSNSVFVTPNLNTNASYSNRGLFLRGGTTAGTFQDDLFRSHTHLELGPADGALTPAVGDFTPNGGEGIQGRNSGAAGGAETRPVNMSVVWIIRVQ